MFQDYLEVATELAPPGTVVGLKDLQQLEKYCTHIQAVARGGLARVHARNADTAARRLQAVYRGHRAREMLRRDAATGAGAVDGDVTAQ